MSGTRAASMGMDRFVARRRRLQARRRGGVRRASGAGAGLNISNSSASILINNGLITAEATGQTLTINNSFLTNGGTLQGNGGTMTVAVSGLTITGMTKVLNNGVLNVDGPAA